MEYLAIAAIALGVLMFAGVVVRSRIRSSGEDVPLVAYEPPPAWPAIDEPAPAPATSATSDVTAELPTALPVPSEASVPQHSEPPEFRVVALGLSGAGKTILLSSLYHELNHPRSTRAYHLQAGAVDSAALAGIRERVIDPDAEWPESTLGSREFKFDFVARDSAGSNRTLLRMSYLEYSGEILRPGDQQDLKDLQRLEAHVQQAHALLGLIDGFQVRKLLEGDPAVDSYFNAVLLPMIGFMQQASCPIQLVITKWDAIQELCEPAATEGDLLKQVKRTLRGIPQIDALLDNQGSRRIRLIPVSAVGPGSVKLVDGKPVKQRGATLSPVNADVPLCAVLPDLLKQAEAALDQSLRRKVAAYVRGRMWQDAGEVVRLLLKSSVGTLLRGIDGVVVFLEWMVHRAPSSGRSKRTLGNDPELERLRAAFIEHMERRVDAFEFMWPDSVC